MVPFVALSPRSTGEINQGGVMSQLDAWQPLCLSRAVGRKPVAARLGNEQFVAFRTSSNGVTVLRDRCPHRGMRLSRGAVRNERLVCPYHGWAFDAQGHGISLGSPGKAICAHKLDATEALGVVWIKSAGAAAAPLQVGFDGFQLLHRAFRDVDVPVELMLDNFTEIEHAGTGHWECGFDGSRMDEIDFRIARGDRDVVTAHAVGPQKPVSWLSRVVLGIEPDDRLHIVWTTSYDPIRLNYEWWWEDPRTGCQRGVRFEEATFFTALGEAGCRLTAFYYWTRPSLRPTGLDRLFRAVVGRFIEYEIDLDINLVRGLADSAVDLKQCQLTRFDGVVVQNRRGLRANSPHGSQPCSVADAVL
jgi:phenylpropionate dioxygenase-like ring-hydroxylating dioxygenase large terminal subunit